MKIYPVTDSRFARYGRIIDGYDFSQVISFLKRESYPEEVEYVAGVAELEALPVFREFQKGFYGELPVQLGYCMGHNDKLNGLEYHRGPEVNISVTDYVVMIGSRLDMEADFRYDTEKVECFYVTAGLAVEFYETTLHYCACHVKPEGYAHATFLPRGTNTPLDEDFIAKTREDTLLQAKNKWLAAHPDGGQAPSVPVTLYGPNWSYKDLEEYGNG
jgi:hypothetical protein